MKSLYLSLTCRGRQTHVCLYNLLGCTQVDPKNLKQKRLEEEKEENFQHFGYLY